MLRSAGVGGGGVVLTHQPDDADTGLAVCPAGSEAPAGRRAAPALGVSTLRTQPPQVRHSNLVSTLLALQSPGAADLLHVEKRWGLVFQAFLTSLARQQICAPGVPGVSLRTPRQPSGRRENVGGVPGGHWIINPVQGALSTRRDCGK